MPLTHRVASLPMAVFSVICIACAGAPISMQVQAGSTILVPLPDISGLAPGFGSEVTQAHQDYDDQRGEFLLCLHDPAQSGTSCDFQLKTRYVTRVYPDAATVGAYAGEILALADIPLPSAGGPLVAQPKQFQIVVKRRLRDLATSGNPYLSPVDYFAGYGTPDLRVTVIPGTGTPNPYVGWDGSMAGSPVYTMDGLYARTPYPQVLIRVGPEGSPGFPKPAALEFDLIYPNSKVSIRGVSEWQSNGRYSVVRYRALSSNSIRISLVDPEQSVAQIAVAFSLSAPTVYGRAALSDFQVLNDRYYGSDGSLYSQSPPFAHPTPVEIR